MNLEPIADAAVNPAIGEPRDLFWYLKRCFLWSAYALATIHLTWFYVYRVPSYLNLARYEAGIERVPFQTRLLMMAPLRWAHASPLLGHWAASLNGIGIWRSRPILPEDIVEMAVNVLAVTIAGLVATELYRTHSRCRVLTPYVYPLVLLMVAVSYCLSTTNFFRYLYDLPSLGLLAIGYLLISRRAHPLLFALLFLVATVNRETSIFLLYFYLASGCMAGGTIIWPRLRTWRYGGTATLLLLFWCGWERWVHQRFAGVRVEAIPGALANILGFFFPPLWPQMAGVAGFMLAAIVVFRRNIPGSELRLWLRVLPLWLAIMLVYGDIVETRLFGELIPIFACAAALIAEERMQLRRDPLLPS